MSLRLNALASRTRPALALVLGVLAATIGLSAAEGTASLAAALAAAAFLAIALTVATVHPPRTLTVGARSRAHRESLTRTPEPSHPDTAGRTRSRAPGSATSAA